jgi:hypothetical protein
MATPAKSVQFRDVDSIVKMYESMKVAAFGIKQNGALNFKYTGEDSSEGAQQLRAFLDMIVENESAAIYTLALYEEPEGRITEKTPADLSFNFRLQDQITGFVPGEMYSGVYGQLMGEIKSMKKELQDLKTAAPESKLGLIGEIMETEAFQPILMAVGNKLADWVLGPAKTGELKRVSGVPTPPEAVDYGPVTADAWGNSAKAITALNRLQLKVQDLPDMLERLANLVEQKPAQFNIYLKMLQRM